MAGDKARRRKVSRSVHCSSCQWKGRRDASASARSAKQLACQSPCPKCGARVILSTRPTGRPPAHRRPLPPETVDEYNIPDTFRARSVLTPRLIASLAARITTSRVHPIAAAAAEGIPATTLRGWLSQAEKDKGDEKSIFVALSVALLKSMGQAECHLAQRGIESAEEGKRGWMAFYRHLESLVPDRWMKREGLEITGALALQVIDTPPEPATNLSAWIERSRAIEGAVPRIEGPLQAQAIDAPFDVLSNEQTTQDQPKPLEHKAIEPIDTGDGWGDGGR